MAKETISIPLPADTFARFEAYRETQPAKPTKADAGRRLMEYGLDVAFSSPGDRAHLVASKNESTDGGE